MIQDMIAVWNAGVAFLTITGGVKIRAVPGNQDAHDIPKFFESFELPMGSREDDVSNGHAGGAVEDGITTTAGFPCG